MESTLLDLKEKILKGSFANEAAVSQGIVKRILHELGWPMYDPEVVKPEYTVGNRRVDLCLCSPPDKPIIFIEIKQIGKSDGAEEQLFQYAFIEGVPLAVLTTGQEWGFYLPSAQGSYGERQVYKLDLVERDLKEVISRLNRYLDYETVCDGNALRNAQEDIQNKRREREIVNTLPKAWGKLLSDAEESLIALVANEVENICGYRPTDDMVINYLQRRYQDIPRQPISAKLPETKQPEISSQIGYTFDGVFHPTDSARDTMINVFRTFQEIDPTFYQRFASLPKHGRARRYLAQDKELLFPGRPDLIKSSAREIAPGWWIGLNFSHNSIKHIIQMACEVAGIEFDQRIKVSLGS
ncbi:MAG: hypothetical protein JW750_01275 [Anaerolineaceae bacterium]|nr:hypothetical protein [Anaerolineaceae bacterium]